MSKRNHVTTGRVAKERRQKVAEANAQREQTNCIECATD